ncbi:tetratricopeptide repeat protein [bacterium]|nr:tetratricopeptide repeat protein [bacterium]
MDSTKFESAKELIGKEDFYGAISILKELIMESPEDWQPYYEISKCYFKMENSDRALQFLESAQQYAQSPEDKEAVVAIIEKIKNPSKPSGEGGSEGEAGDDGKDSPISKLSPVVLMVDEHREKMISPLLVNVASLVPGGGLLLLGKLFSGLFVFLISGAMLFPLIKQKYLHKINAYVFPKIEDFLYEFLQYTGELADAYKILFGVWIFILVIIYLKSITVTRKTLIYKSFVCVIREVLQENEICLSIGSNDGVQKGSRFKVSRIIVAGDSIGGTHAEPPFGRVKHIGFADVLQCEENICFAKYEFIESNMVTPEKDDIAFCIRK